MRMVLSFLLAASSAFAGEFDYLECVSADGRVSHAVGRCDRGEVARQVASDLAPLSIKLGSGGASVIRLQRRHGHYVATIVVNGVPMSAMVDTGATLVSVSPSAAARAGLDRQPYRSGWMNTANGVAPARYITAASVELGGIVVRNVPASILSQNMRGLDVLLGMSFLNHFHVSIADVEMTLTRK